jgi:hypothetical protein
MCQARIDDVQAQERSAIACPSASTERASTSSFSSPERDGDVEDREILRVPKSRKRQQAELKAQLRAKRNTSVNSLTSLGSQKERPVYQSSSFRSSPPKSATECYKEVLTQDACPHLARWLSEEPSEGVTWDFERYYQACDTCVLSDEALLPDALSFLMKDRKKDEKTIIAIDLEWRPDQSKTANNPVALIQLATTTRCVLLRTIHWDTSGVSGIPEPLHRFFSECPNRFFVGFSWDSGDGKKMLSTFGVGKSVFSNFCDLQELAQVLGYGKKCGLAWLTKEVVGAELTKAVARSNWERAELSAEQVVYGALDAFSLHAILAGWKLSGGV